MTDDRAGPPSPRAKPWTPDVVGPEQYAARDAAFAEWLSQFDGLSFDLGQRGLAEIAFRAGWAARKLTDFQKIINHNPKKLVDNRIHAMSPLFPTDAELDG